MTPANVKHLQTQVTTILRSNPSERTIRLLFAKTGKTLASLTFQNTEQGLRLAKQAKVVDEYRAKKRRKITVDPNDQFVGIEQIIAAQAEVEQRQAAWEQQDRAKDAREQAELMARKGMEPFMYEFHVLDLVDA